MHIKKISATSLFCILRHIFDAEADASHLVFSKAYNFHNIAQCQNVFYMVDTLFCDLGDVYHTFFSRSELKESTELFDADDFTGVDLSLS